ncbi:chitobiase/beta-hexosaminidase C-terminal domain-containing protein [Dyadobacter endophyticus]|uniref:chitobiase/beta-hexosaminidase C-terminal domain-containing protein n=1 Tax=Dyadobacter endophyticus TaxID=1749036 RepID=UPI003CF4F1DD
MAVTITTTSCETEDEYFLNKATAIYPAFVDNLPYEAWTDWVSNATIAQTSKPYFQFKAAGGTTYQWEVEPNTNSVLPPGLSLLQNGQLSGTPTKEGLFEFTLRATSGADYDTKRFKFKVYPERSRWLRDARFGVTTHWGRFTYPAIQNSPPRDPPLNGTGTQQFEGRVTQLNAANWAQQMEAWGAGFIEFSAIWQDSYRNWISTTPTRYQLHTENRDFVDEIVAAFHARNLKVISYFCPDYRGNPACVDGTQGCTDPVKFSWTDADSNGNWGTPNLGYITELVVNKKIDGLWMDIGGASDIYGNPPINPGWLYYDKVIPVIRHHNPFFIFGVNPGVRGSFNTELKFGGTQVLYPYADFVIYESTLDSSTNAIMSSEQATPLMSKKKMAIYVSNKVTRSWGWGATTHEDPIKDPVSVNENIGLNWKAGATVSMGLPVRCDGLLLDPRFQPIMSAIGNYVTTNKAFSEDPQISLLNNTVTITTSLPARIFYTLDGTDPDENSSNVYLNPIPITRNTIIKVRTLQTGKSLGFMKQLVIEGYSTSGPVNLLLGEKPNDTLSYQEVTNLYKTVDNSRFYRGMQFTVGSAPIIITGIGRRSVGTNVTRNVIVKRYFDEYPVYSGNLLPDISSTGDYYFTDIAEIRLEAGMTYIIAIQELSNEKGIPDADRKKYYANTFTDIPYTRDLRIIQAFNLSPLGDFYPFPLDHNNKMDTVGQIVNLKYRVVSDERKYDLALGKPVRFLSGIGGSQLIPSQYIRYAINATDGNPNSYAIAGGVYANTVRVNLLSLNKINRIAFRFTPYNYATEFEIYCSTDENGSDAVLMNHYVNNKNLDFQFKFDPVLTQYVFFKSILPNAPGQEGGSMGFESIEVYCDGL